MGYVRKRIRYVSAEEMKKHLEYVKEHMVVVYREKTENETFGRKAFIEDKLVEFRLSYAVNKKATTYITYKDDRPVKQQINGADAFTIMSKYFKVPRMPEEICGKYTDGGLSAAPLLWKNNKYDGTRNEAWGYDLNSAYSYGLLQKMPDTSVKPRKYSVVRENEIGFIEVPVSSGDRPSLKAVYQGNADWVFPLMESPFKNFVKKWYGKKCDALPGTEEKDKAKGVLNYSVGYLQKVNPFLRATVITHCNNFIKSLIDDDTIYCNTDSIVSLRPREDFNIGSDVGQWKLEHHDLFAYKGFNYQWGKEVPSYRHIPKSWFPENFDILVDDLPKGGNVYTYEKGTITFIGGEENEPEA